MQEFRLPDLPERFNAAGFFVDQNLRAGRGGRTAFRYRGRSITYAEVAESVARAAGALLGLGLRAGERILLASQIRRSSPPRFSEPSRQGSCPFPSTLWSAPRSCAITWKTPAPGP